jgi:hypothetical protein
MSKRKKQKKAVILVPLTYNDGSRVPDEVLEAIYDEVYETFGAYTIEGQALGAYRMSSGEKRVERLERFCIVVTEAELPTLRKMVARWGRMLGQETMYLETVDSHVEFLSPHGRGDQR